MTKLPIVGLALVALTGSFLSSQELKLDSRIGSAVKDKYATIQNGSDWLNPYLALCPSGAVDLIARSVKHRSEVSFSELRAALVKLPVEAWPYGRVVAVAECSVGSPGDEQVRRERRLAVEAVLKELDVQADFWPP